MTLTERIRVKASAAQVWVILGDVSFMGLWNPKCVRCDAPGSPARVGLRFKAAFRLGEPERQADCEVIDCRPECLLMIWHSGDFSGRGIGHVDESFQLRPSRGDTRIVHAVDYSCSGLPWALLAFLKIMDVVGRKASKSSLDCLKELVENPAHRGDCGG